MAAESPTWASLLGMGAVIAAALAVGAVIGFVVDSQLDTTPIFVLVGLAVGIVGGIAYTVSQFRKYLGPAQPAKASDAHPEDPPK